MDTEQFDYIIVGAGSAGCVLANRLTEDPAVRVLVLEYGGSDRSVIIQMPSAFSMPMNTSKYNWRYQTAPEAHLNGRQLHCPRGKVLGGSSSINGLVYIRGHACDFDEWEELGARGWGYRNCLPYFRRAESYKFGGDEYRGAEGPLSTNNGNNMANPLYGAWIEAGAEAGYIKTEDCNGHMQEGFGAMHMTVKNGVRWSTANAYLRPAMKRPNLTVVTNAMTRHVILEGKRAVGVVYDQGGLTHTARCRAEVLIASGPIGSPHLLQRSGIGPADVLRNAGIEVRHDLARRGREPAGSRGNLYPVCVQGARHAQRENGSVQQVHDRVALASVQGWSGASNHFEAGGFIRSEAGLRWPDIQFHFLPAAMRYDGDKPFKGHGFMVLTGPNKPKSRGYVRATSADPYYHPEIRFNYLDREEDREGFRRCVRLTREIIGQPAMDRFRDVELSPGPDVQTDEQIDAFVRANLESTMHPCGSCRMGEDDMAVVDSELRVRGIDGLRVIDSSVFPTEPNGNLNAPTIMLAERASDLVRAVSMLPASDAEVGLAEGWETRQRTHAPTRNLFVE